MLHGANMQARHIIPACMQGIGEKMVSSNIIQPIETGVYNRLVKKWKKQTEFSFQQQKNKLLQYPELICKTGWAGRQIVAGKIAAYQICRRVVTQFGIP